MPTNAASRGGPNESAEMGRSSPKMMDNRVTRLAAAILGGALLALGLRRRSLGGAATALAGGWVLYRTFGASAGRHRRDARALAELMVAERSITIGKPADELHRLWRDPERLSQVMGRFAGVTSAGEDRLQWSLRGPLGRTLSWETEVVEEQPGEFLRWASVEGAPVVSEGSIRLRPAPADRGTEVTLRLWFDPPGPLPGGSATKVLGVVPDALVGTVLRRFKSLAEAGEIPTLERNPSGRGSGDLL